MVRATADQLADAQLLLEEYYEAIGVVKRDSPEEIAAILSATSSALWIAYMGPVPAGCVVLRPLSAIASAAECKRLFLRPRFRGRGVADLLMDALEDYALAGKTQWVYLDSKEDLRDALRLYKKRGYQECERYNDNPQATIFLRKEMRLPSGRC